MLMRPAIRIFSRPFEFNLIGSVWNLRLGFAQIALWRNYEPIFDIRPRFARRWQAQKAPQEARGGLQIYGWFDDPWQHDPSYDPPHNAPCLFCGKPVTADDVRTHSLMYAGTIYAKRSYFYRTHRTCAEKDSTRTARDGIVLEMIAANGD